MKRESTKTRNSSKEEDTQKNEKCSILGRKHTNSVSPVQQGYVNSKYLSRRELLTQEVLYIHQFSGAGGVAHVVVRFQING